MQNIFINFVSKVWVKQENVVFYLSVQNETKTYKFLIIFGKIIQINNIKLNKWVYKQNFEIQS